MALRAGHTTSTTTTTLPNLPPAQCLCHVGLGVPPLSPFPSGNSKVMDATTEFQPSPISSPPPNQKAPAPAETQIHSANPCAAGARRMWLAYCSLFTVHLPRFASFPVPWNFKGRQRTRERKGAKEGQRTSRLCKASRRPRMWCEARLRESRASRPRGWGNLWLRHIAVFMKEHRRVRFVNDGLPPQLR